MPGTAVGVIDEARLPLVPNQDVPEMDVPVHDRESFVGFDDAKRVVADGEDIPFPAVDVRK